MSGSNYLHYKGYVGTALFSEEDAVFHGRVVGIQSVVSYEGESVNDLIEDFHNAVDEYLDFCEKTGKTPERPFKGSFNVRIGSELHRRAVMAASARGVSLNTLVEDAIRQSISP